MILVNGIIENQIDISDRGLQYGDGVFETIAFRSNKLEFLDDHLERLQLGCARLKISFNELDQLTAELQQVCDSLLDGDAVVKVIITRGTGGRGYLAMKDIVPTRIISTHAMPTYPSHYQEQGIKVRFCQHRLSLNPSLAGIKHLNRLDQVIARNEWSDNDIAEGIMLDQQDLVIEGTMSNLFVVKSGQLFTPSLASSGIAGIMRKKIIQLAKQNAISVTEKELTVSALLAADELFVCNSINGIWPVTKICDIDKIFSPGQVTQHCQSLVKQVQYSCAG